MVCEFPKSKILSLVPKEGILVGKVLKNSMSGISRVDFNEMLKKIVIFSARNDKTHQ